MKVGTLLSCAASLALAGQAMAAPISITTADGLGADAMVISNASYGSFGNKYGGTNDLSVGRDYVSYIRFDLDGVDVSQLATAELILTTRYGNRPVQFQSIWGLVDGYAGGNDWGGDGTNDQGESWAEDPLGTGISGLDAPGWNGTAVAPESTVVYGGATLASWTPAAITIGTKTHVSSQALLDFLMTDTDGVVTFILHNPDPLAGSSPYTYGSKEWFGNAPPELVLTVPEPASIGLLGVGGALCFFRRRRR